MRHNRFSLGILALLLITGVLGVSACAPAIGSAYGPETQDYAQAIPDWVQVNSNGFGDPTNGDVTALESFNGYFYAGTHNAIDPGLLFDGAQIFRSPDGVTWTPVTQPGFGNSHDIAPPAILDFIVFNNQLYASTGRGNASQIWRSLNGTIWAPMDVTGFSDPDNVDITALAVYDGMIYAGVTNQVTGAQIWTSFTGDNNSWTQVAPDIPGTVVSTITSFAEFGGALYAAVESETPAQIWQSYGGPWTTVVGDGFGDSNNLSTGGMAVFGGYLYVGAGNAVNGAQLWRTIDGMAWEQAISPGFGDPNNLEVEAVFVFQNQLYVGVKNTVTGMEIWRSADGTLWEQANLDGFGDGNNSTTNGGNAMTLFMSQLYVGTSNVVDGGELWRMLNANTPPTDITLSNTTVDENQPVNTVVGALSATDPDAGATFTFSLACTVAGGDDGSFNILGTNLQTSVMFDYETKSSYNICIRVTDQGGLTFDKNFVITVNNLVENTAPTDIALSNTTVDENQPVNTVVGTLSATDPDVGATFTFSLACTVAGVDDGSFNILGTNLQTSAIFDFETKSTQAICIRVTDQGGLSLDKNFVITVNNVNEMPADISLSNNTVDENRPINTVVGGLSATDPDAGATFTFNLTCLIAGMDDGSFNISGADLRTSVMFDYETKSTYNICVRVTDQGGLSFDKNFVITVNNLVENTAPTDIALSKTTVDENQPVNTVVGTLSATDPDAGAMFTFSLACTVAGVDDGSFNILGTNLQTSAIFDFETKSTYAICIRVTDQGGLSFDKNFVIMVNNLVENTAPTNIALSETTVDENQPVNTVVGTLSATDPDVGATFTFSLACTVAGVDDGSFNILGTNLQTSVMFDFETKSNYKICVRVTDQGGLSFDKNFFITVNDLLENSAPTDIAISKTSVDENQPPNTVVGALTANDPDAGATFTFSLTCAVAGADDGSFNILGTNLRTSAIFDFETKSAYNICVRVTDQGGLFFDKNFVVIVNNLFENTAPTDISLSNNAVNENQPINTVIGALSATDPDAGASFTFSLVCAVSGADDGSFNIFGTDLRTSANFDFETKPAYNICVRVTDQGGLTFDKNFVVTVNNINEAPTDIALSNSTVDENQPVNTVVGTLTPTDPDAGGTFTVSLTCAIPGVDDGSFNIDGTNLQTSASFDFETKSNYNICIRVTDQGGLFFDKSFTVTVNDVHEMTNTAGKVMGGGNVNLPGGKATFGFVVQYDAGTDNPSGSLTFKDHARGLSLKATSFTLLYVNGNHATIIGYATVNGVSNLAFTLDVTDMGEPGTYDTFTLQIPALNGYSAGGVLKGGNIQITMP